jgi:hypothetical protein
MVTLVDHRQTYTLTPQERTLLEEFRKLDSRQQSILLNALRHLGSGVPGARLVLAVDR